jgi:hypothetical protein
MFSLSLKAGTHTAQFPQSSGCIPMHPSKAPGDELTLATLIYATQPDNDTLHIVPSISLAANKYYRVHAPEFLQRYRLPPATPGFTHSRILASGQLHEKLWATGYGANPTTSLPARPLVPPSDWLVGPPVSPSGRLVLGDGDPQATEGLRQTCKLAHSSPARLAGDGPAASSRATPLQLAAWLAAVWLPRILSPSVAAAAAAVTGMLAPGILL